MFCTKCGKNCSDTAKFCTGCGTPLSAAPVYEPPVYNPPAFEPPVPASAKAKDPAKLMGLIARFVPLLLILILVLGYISLQSTPIPKIPVAHLTAGEYLEEAEELLDESVDEIVYYFEKDGSSEIISEYGMSAYNEISEFIDLAQECNEEPTLKNLDRMVELIRDLKGSEADQWLELYESIEGNYIIDGAAGLLKFINTVILAIGLFFLLISAAGGIFLSKALTVTGAILSCIFFYAFCGPLFLIINLVIHAAMFTLILFARKE